MTTIVIENKILYADSYSVEADTRLSSRVNKIAYNATNTLAYAYTGSTLPTPMLKLMVQRLEFDLVNSYILECATDEPSAKEPRKALSMMQQFLQASRLERAVYRSVLALGKDYTYKGEDREIFDCHDNAYTAIGCYTDSYGLYRKMNLSPADAFARIFNFATVTAGPLNIALASSLNIPDISDYVRQVSDGVEFPVLKAKPAEPVKTKRMPASKKATVKTSTTFIKKNHV